MFYWFTIIVQVWSEDVHGNYVLYFFKTLYAGTETCTESCWIL